MKKYYINLSLALVMAGCGSSSNDKQTQYIYNGIAADGYLKNAKICLDTNLDLSCDEKAVFTNEFGAFKLITKQKISPNHAIIAIGGEDIITGKTQSEVLSYPGSKADMTKKNIISPISSIYTSLNKTRPHEANKIFSSIVTNENNDKYFHEDFFSDSQFDKNAYKSSQKLQKLIELSPLKGQKQAYESLASKFADEENLSEFAKNNNFHEGKKLIDYLDSLSEEDFKAKRDNIAKELQKSINKGSFNPPKIEEIQKDDVHANPEKPNKPSMSADTRKGHLYHKNNKNATIFIDKNLNGMLDEGEIKTSSDEEGNFYIDIKDEQIDTTILIALLPNEHEELLFTGTRGKIFDITPLSSFRTAAILSVLQGKSKLTIDKVSSVIDELLGIEDNTYSKDPKSDLKYFRINLALSSLIKGLALSVEDDRSLSKKIYDFYIIFSSNMQKDKVSQGLSGLLEDYFKLNFIKDEVKQSLKKINQIASNISSLNDNESLKLIEEELNLIKSHHEKKQVIKANAYHPDLVSNDFPELKADEFSKYQWHIVDQGALIHDEISTVGSNSNERHDLDLAKIYKQKIFGQSAKVRIVDDGYYANHEDLKNALDLTNSYNAKTKQKDPTPESKDTHGTQVAGIIGADGTNAKGLRGVAPMVKMEAFKIRTLDNGGIDLPFEDLKIAWLGGDKENVGVVNNSWGSTAMEKNPEDEELLKKGATGSEYRNGLGRIYLIAAGNSGLNQDGNISAYSDDAGTSYTRGSQYAITVGAVRNENVITQYSSQGANVLVSSYGGGAKPSTAALIATTTVPNTSKHTWKEDVNKQYTYAFNGTSAATPVASGALALVLDACSYLSYRDVKWLIAHTARKIDINYDGKTKAMPNILPFSTAPALGKDGRTKQNGWGYVQNAAGLSHSNYYGYGIIDPVAMIEKCKGNQSTWHLPQKRENTILQTTTSLENINSKGSAKEIVYLNKPTQADKQIDKIEWVGVTIWGNFKDITKLSMVLISPSGTPSRILTHSATARDELSEFDSGYRLSSVAFMGENPYGEWKLLVHTDSEEDKIGRVEKFQLEVVGHKSN